MSVLSWGKPRIFVKSLGVENAAWKELDTPVVDTTQLSTEKGEKVEAQVEGGENEDVRYGKNTYALALTLRAAKGRNKPLPDADGIISDDYSIALQPEDPETPGLMIDRATASLEETWSAADGGQWAYTFDVLRPATGNQIKWGQVAVSENGEVTFTENK